MSSQWCHLACPRSLKLCLGHVCLVGSRAIAYQALSYACLHDERGPKRTMCVMLTPQSTPQSTGSANNQWAMPTGSRKQSRGGGGNN